MHSLADLCNPDGTLNPAALLQAASLLNCLQNNNRPAAQSLLAQSGTAQILVWTWFPETLPPDFAVIIDGDTIYIVIIGTMNATQWTGQIAGATATPYPGQPGVSVGAFWAPIAAQASTEISTLAQPGITRMVIVGHSYGAAIAQLVAMNFAANPGQLTSVDCLLLGGPNPVTAGYSGTLPNCMHRVAIVGDIVPQLPPTGFATSLPLAVLSNWVTGAGPQWAYYGTGWTLGTAGGLTANPATRPTVGGAIAAAAAGNLNIHLIENYLAAAIATYQATAGTPQVSAWLPGANAVANAPNPQIPAPPIDPGTWVNVPGANAVYFPDTPALITAGNVGTIQSVQMAVTNAVVQSVANIQVSNQIGANMAASNFKKITLIANNDLYGRLYSTVLNQAGTLSSCLTQASTLASRFASCFGNALTAYTTPTPPFPYPQARGTPTIDFVRISDALNPRVSQIFTLGGPNYAGFTGGKSADFQATSLSMRLIGVSSQTVPPSIVPEDFQHYGNLLVVGAPDDCVQAGSYVPGVVIFTGVTEDARLKILLNYMTAGTDLYGFMGLDYTQLKKQTGPFTIFNVNFWQFTITAHGYTTGDRVSITGANALGFNGHYLVNVIDANTLYLLDGPRVQLAPPTKAFCRRIQAANGTRFRQFYRYQPPDGGWNSPFGIHISKKNPGRRFTGVSFTKRKRRPR
jgi:pimeloyl-ACP methyl ester carboxylesterase